MVTLGREREKTAGRQGGGGGRMGAMGHARLLLLLLSGPHASGMAMAMVAGGDSGGDGGGGLVLRAGLVPQTANSGGPCSCSYASSYVLIPPADPQPQLGPLRQTLGSRNISFYLQSFPSICLLFFFSTLSPTPKTALSHWPRLSYYAHAPVLRLE